VLDDAADHGDPDPYIERLGVIRRATIEFRKQR